jgi:hypothetical protein
MIDVPAVVRNKARAAGADDWLERLTALVSSLEADWSTTVGHPYEGGTEAFVADATRADGTPAVLKVLVPGTGNNPSNEATVLRLVGGDGCPVLYRHHPDQGALLRFSGTPFHGRGAADYSEALIDVIVDRQGSDAGIGCCGTANSPAQMGGESEYLSDAVCLALHAIST